jgi:hypothetical protein
VETESGFELGGWICGLGHGRQTEQGHNDQEPAPLSQF